MDVVQEVKRLVQIEKNEKIKNQITEMINKDLNIYRYTYDEFEISGVGYILAKDTEDAKSKIPYINEDGFSFTLEYIISLNQLQTLLYKSKVEVDSGDMDWDIDEIWFKDLLKEA